MSELNTIQIKLIEKVLKKGKSTQEVYEALQAQRNLCKKVLAYKEECFARKTFKKSVMVTANYGGTQSSSRSDVIEQLKAIDSGFITDCTPEELVMFTDIVYWSMSAAVPAAMQFLNYFQKLLSFILKHKESVYYTHPLTGAPVHLVVKKEQKTAVRFRVNNRERAAVLYRKTNETNVRKTTTSTVPSITHSTDAAILLLTKSLMLDIPMAFIHDSIGVHPNNIRTAKDTVNKVLLKSAKTEIYEQIRDQLLHGIKDVPEELMRVPTVNDWDTWEEDIKAAYYAFS